MVARAALVTGVSSGLGSSLAEALLGRGWRVPGMPARLRELPSGAFVDLRELLDPEAYRRLYGAPPEAVPR